MPLTDNDTANAIARWKNKLYPKARPQDLESLVLQWLNATSWYLSSYDKLGQVMLKNRVLSIMRSKGAKKAVATKRKKKQRDKESALAGRQLTLL